MNAAVARLSVVEGRRILLHPAVPILLAFMTVFFGLLEFAANDLDRKVVYDGLFTLFAFALPLTTPFAANLVASSGRRAGTEELLAALPTDRGRRALAVCVGACGLALVSLVAGIALYHLRTGEDDPFTAWHAATLPVVYLGAAAYGVMVARWLPWRGAILVTTVLLFVWVGGATASWHDSATAVASMPYYLSDDLGHLSFDATADTWHFGYLLCLVGLAVTAATFKERPRRMVCVGAVIGGLAVLCTVLTVR